MSFSCSFCFSPRRLVSFSAGNAWHRVSKQGTALGIIKTMWRRSGLESVRGQNLLYYILDPRLLHDALRLLLKAVEQVCLALPCVGRQLKELVQHLLVSNVALGALVTIRAFFANLFQISLDRMGNLDPLRVLVLPS